MCLHIFMDLSLQFRGIGLGLRLWLLPCMRVVDVSRVKAVIAIVNKKSRFNLVMACFISYVLIYISFTSAVFIMFTMMEFGRNPRQQSMCGIR